MSRYGRRVSRGLIAALIITLVLGTVSYLKNLGTTHAEEAAIAPQPAPEPTPAVATPAAAPAVATPPPAKTEQTDIFTSSLPTAPVQPNVIPNDAAPAPKPVEVATATQAPAPTPAPAPSSEKQNALTAGQSKKNAGDLLGARKTLNEALLASQFSATDAAAARKLMAEINQTVVFSSQRFADDEFGGTYSVQPGNLLQNIAAKYDVTWEALLRLNGMSDPKKLRAGQTIKTIKGPFNAVVYKKDFRMDIYLGKPEQSGSMYVTSYGVGLGKDDSTPTGTWQVEPGKKLKNPTYFSPRGEGIVAADDPKNPLGERWIGLVGIEGHAMGKPSYGIHGTIDETSIGKQESMGCIRLHNADVEWVFDLLVEGKSVVVVKE